MSSTLLEIASITIGQRQRTRIDARALNDLVLSITEHGLLQPIGVWRAPPDGEAETEIRLVWGGRRLAAVSKLAGEGRTIRAADGTEVPLGQIPVIFFDATADLIARKGAELDENAVREDITWQERTHALAEIHLLRSEQNPAQTVSGTAKELVAAGASGAAPSLRQTREMLAQALVVRERLTDPDVAKAKGLTDAFRVVQRKDAQAAEAALIKRRTVPGTPTSPESLVTFLNGDWRALLREQPPADLILTDPPFGIRVDERRPEHARQTVVHRYDDSPETVLPMLQDFLLAAFNATKPRGNLFMFCDIDHFVWLRDAASRQGWAPFRTPVVWDKITPGIGPWQAEGFQRRYELILFATKGAAGLRAPMPDVLQHRRVEKTQRIHGAQKPTPLLEILIDATTIPGDLVIDPFAGSGSTLIAARSRSRRAVGIELDPAVYDVGLSHVFGTSGAYSPEDFV